MRLVSVFAAAVVLVTTQSVHAQDADRVKANSSTTDPASQTTGYTPLTGGQRVLQFLRYTFSPFSLTAAAASAGIGQWRDRPPEWKQGAEGYGDRYASAYAEHMVRGVLLFGAASALHEDVRYFPLRAGSFGERLHHAVVGPFTARHNDGSTHFSISRITAFAGAALISRTWQPRSTDGLNSAASNFGTSTGMAVGIDVLREFWPQKKK